MDELACRSGVTSSRIQNERPCVAAIRSLSLMREIVNRCGRQVELQRLPVRAIVAGEVNASLGAGVEQAFDLRVFAHRAGVGSRGNAVG